MQTVGTIPQGKAARQGDVFVFNMDAKAPDDLKFQEVPNVVLAAGTVTGHKHNLIKEDPATIIKSAKGTRKAFGGDRETTFVTVENGNAILAHEEHGNILVQPGLYKVVIQEEFDIIEQMRKVMD
jgi:hypothetical protein